MKLKITLISTIVLSVSGLALIVTNGDPLKKKSTVQKAKVENQTISADEGMVHGASKRLKWEISRLSDPAIGRIPDNIRQLELAFAATLPNDLQVDRSMASLTMTNRGPWNVGGRTRAFGVDVSNENRLLAGSCSGGMWISTNGGSSWAQTNTLSQLKNATCLVQDKRPTHTDTWYYGSGEGYGASASGTGAYYLGDGVFKSTNGGITWSPLAATAGGNPNAFAASGWQVVWNIANDISTNDSLEEIYAATYGFIYRSVNGGATWSAVRSGSSYFTDVQVTTTGVVYATLSDDGSQKGIWRAENDSAFKNIIPVA